MARIITHFGRINNQHRRQERKLVLENVALDTEENPWWIIEYTISYRSVEQVEIRLRQAVQDGRLIFENKVRRGKRGHRVRDVIYLWSPNGKFALKFTKYINSSPHFLEVTGDLEAARRAMSSWGL